jgi:hypothetical protein
VDDAQYAKSGMASLFRQYPWHPCPAHVFKTLRAGEKTGLLEVKMAEIGRFSLRSLLKSDTCFRASDVTTTDDAGATPGLVR